MELKPGEVAAIRIPAAAVKQLADFHAGVDPGEDHPAPRWIGVFSKESLLAALSDSPAGIGEIVDATDGSVDLTVAGVRIAGSAVPERGTVRMDLEVSEGPASVHCLARVPEGGVMFLLSAGERPEGILIAVGRPAGSSDEDR